MMPLDTNIAAAPWQSVSSHASPFWKRLLDIACIIVALPLLVPLMLAIAGLVKCVSRGPVLFKQIRIGYHGRPFRCFKFRTMHVGAPENNHADHCKQLIRDQKSMTKMDEMGDPRLIPTAPFLRAAGLDELPQLYNVLRGEMSLVGPRPCTPYEWDSYLPWHKSRFQTLPGLTGLWQVSGKNNTTFEEMVHLDIDYAARRSLWLDVSILLRTTVVVAEQTRAALGRKLRLFKRTSPISMFCEEGKN